MISSGYGSVDSDLLYFTQQGNQCSTGAGFLGGSTSPSDDKLQRLAALDAVCGALWRRPLLTAERCQQLAALEAPLQPHVMHWTAGLGGWALLPEDAAFMIHLSAVRSSSAASRAALPLARSSLSACKEARRLQRRTSVARQAESQRESRPFGCWPQRTKWSELV